MQIKSNSDSSMNPCSARIMAASHSAMRPTNTSNNSTSSSFPKGVYRHVSGPTETRSTSPICMSFRFTAENVSRSESHGRQLNSRVDTIASSSEIISALFIASIPSTFHLLKFECQRRLGDADCRPWQHPTLAGALKTLESELYKLRRAIESRSCSD